MGFWDFLKKRTDNSGYMYAPTMSGGVPFFAPFGDNVYASDLVLQSIRCKANEFKKLQPRHVRTMDGVQSAITDSSISKCLRRPNAFMTTADFLEKITILFELNKNVFIYPEYYVTQGGEKYYTALYPLKPSTVDYLVDGGGRYYIQFTFASGYKPAPIPVDDIIHWRKDYGVNEYFGGGISGGDDNRSLLKMVQRYDQLTQSISKALECSCQINGIMKINSYLDDEKTEAARQEFETAIKSNKSGILFSDMKSDYTHIPRDIKLVDSETLKFFNEAILRANGTSLAILNGDYTKAQKEAYYEHALEADIISLGQAISRCVFSDRETSFGNEIILYPNRINFMSMENKIAFAQIAMPSGSMLKDEFRELFGYPPLPDGQGQVISQGYNNLLDDQNKNTLNGEG